MPLGLTPSQTVGPFFGLQGGGLPWPGGPYAVAEGTPGAVWIRGQVLDGEGAPVADALIETWQAVAGHRGFARCPTDASGCYGVLTVKPASDPGPDGRPQAPHLAMSVFARGLLDRVVTRVYFADEAAANEADPVLALVDPARRGTLIAEPTGDGYRLDIRLQGEGETVFFDI
jgi:protocatechuate 3,4-dioxygenase alpha subunit